MSAEDIAKVIADVRAGKCLTNMPQGDRRAEFFEKAGALLRHSTTPVVDVTPVYDQWMASKDGNYVYEDHTLMFPPWTSAVLCYQNPAGNVIVMQFMSCAMDEMGSFPRWQPGDRKVRLDDESYVRMDNESTADPDSFIDWDSVEYGTTVLVYSGGRHSSGIPVPTAGPLHMWRIPVYQDGTMADIQWTQLNPQLERNAFDNALMVLLETVAMCNCVNVVVAESSREMSRPERRRIERTGVRFSEIHIRPVSKSYRGKGTPLREMRPQHGVRGHFSTYGTNGRGLLFGKHAGKFWIPPHVRGTKEAGEVLQEYVAEPE